MEDRFLEAGAVFICDKGQEYYVIITYTVKEVAIEGYESKVEGNAKDGFVITNKNIAKTEVPVSSEENIPGSIKGYYP